MVFKTENGNSVFLVKRFDRKGAQRLGFASGLTVMGPQALTLGHPSRSYMNLFKSMVKWGEENSVGLEIWKRIAFNALVGNIDDHPRNHAMIFDGQWKISPAFDIVPTLHELKVAGLAMPFSIKERKLFSGATALNVITSSENYGVDTSFAKNYFIETAHLILKSWLDVMNEKRAPQSAFTEAEPMLERIKFLLMSAQNLENKEVTQKGRGWKNKS